MHLTDMQECFFVYFDYAHDDGTDVRIQHALDRLRIDDVNAVNPDTAQASHKLILIHPAGWRQGEAAALSQLESRSAVTRTTFSSHDR